MKKVQIEEQTALAIITYLGRQPFAEVQGIIFKLQQELQGQITPAEDSATPIKKAARKAPVKKTTAVKKKA